MQYGKLMHDQVVVTNQWLMNKLVSGAGITGSSYGKNKIRLYLYTKHKKELRVYKNLNMKHKT